MQSDKSNKDLSYKNEERLVGLVDADLLDNGTRHPNLVLMKIAGFLHDNSKPLFVGIEAKVDESFGPTVAERLAETMAKRWNGKSTNAPERVEKLVKRIFPKEVKAKHTQLRYQLLTAIAGTLDVEKDWDNKAICHRVFLVVEFNTGAEYFDKKKSEANHQDYNSLIKCVKEEWKDADSKSFVIEDKKIYYIYEQYKMNEVKHRN